MDSAVIYNRLFKGCLSFLLLLVLCQVMPGDAWAQGDEAELLVPLNPSDLATPDGQTLVQGMQYAAREDYASASLVFYTLFAESDAPESLRFRAEYELAKVLMRMQLYYPALYFFDGIVAYGADHPMFLAAYPWLLRLQRLLPGDTHMLDRIVQYEDFFPHQIEAKYRDQMAYSIGRHYFTRGFIDEAQSYLESVSTASRYFGQARYLLGVSLIQRYEGQQAVDAFRSVIEWVLQTDDDDSEMRGLAELAVLSVARTFYSTGEYATSLRWYEQVPESSRYWLDALFESSWGLFQLEEYNRALGNLHSLNAPFFDDEFYPEGMILLSVIFFRNCNYDVVREVIEEFKVSYIPFQEKLNEITSSLSQDIDYYNLVRGLQGEQENDFNSQLQQLLNAAVDHRTIAEAIDFVIELERQNHFIERADPSWRDTSLGDDLLTATGLARSVAASRAGELISRRIGRAERELGDLLNQAEAILVETDLMEQSIIDERLRNELNLSGTGLLPPSADEEHLMWHFSGEYWQDELGHYWYAIQSRCAEVGF